MRPDVVLLTGWHAWPLLQLLAAARRLRVPAIVRGDSNALRHRPALVRWLHRRLMRRYDAFLSVGRSNRDFYLACGVDPLRIFDAPHCVDNARFETLARKFHAQREALRERWGIPAGVTCFCYAGKLEAKKRIFDLLAALERAHAQAPMHLLVVGDGALLADARDFAAQRKLPVTFAGFLNQGEIPAAYAAADCLVLPSDARETWGLVVNEAMACGIAAIVSDRVGCAADLITPGATGEVFPLGDVGALASRLAAAAREPQRLREMGERARQRVCEGYSIERAVEGTVRGALSVAGAT